MAHAGIVLFLFISIFMGSVQLLSIYQESSLMNILTLEALSMSAKKVAASAVYPEVAKLLSSICVCW